LRFYRRAGRSVQAARGPWRRAITTTAMGVAMSKKMRVIIAFVVIELMLIGIWVFLSSARAKQGDNSSSTATDAVKMIGETMGTAMGVVAAFFLLLLFLAARNDRNA
jgi:hypothetical protein